MCGANKEDRIKMLLICRQNWYKGELVVIVRSCYGEI